MPLTPPVPLIFASAKVSAPVVRLRVKTATPPSVSPATTTCRPSGATATARAPPMPLTPGLALVTVELQVRDPVVRLRVKTTTALPVAAAT